MNGGISKKSTEPSRFTNWPAYNESLVKRGDVTLWLEEDVILSWQHENAEPKVGAPYTYSNEAIVCLLSTREVFRLTYRQTEGFGRSLVRMMGVDLKIPDYTSLQKRATKATRPLGIVDQADHRQLR